ncbi:MAG: diguanylate cyclase [Magnetococcales bacterium]|nr:diguanylate cyclase [Magnetococcales bacterium]MBF0438784.1 diguanylate cyclase [Magnetococcales bacterium]
MNLFNRLLIWQKFTLGFVVIASFFIGIVFFYHISMKELGENYEELISKDFTRFSLGSELSHKLALMRDVEYNFRLSPKNSLAEDHQNYFKEFQDKLLQLTALEQRSGREENLKAPKGILQHINVYRDAFASSVHAWKNKEVDAAAEENLEKMEEANQAIEFLVEYHFSQVRKDMKQASQETQTFARHRTKLAFTMAIVLIALMILIAFLLVNSLVHPISKVTKAMLHVADGNMESQVPVIGKDELGQMATIFNQMAQQLKAAHNGLQIEQDKLKTILLSAREGIIGTNREGHVVLVNPAAVQLLGKTEEQIVEGGFLNMFDDPDYVQQFLARSGIDMPETIVYNKKVFNFFAATIKDKTDEIVGCAALIRDVTEEKKLERQLRDLSNTDGLTKLNNRRYFDELMNGEYQRGKRYGVPFGLLLFDVDHFKKFNDTHGHDQGDRVLQAIANCMRATFRDVDHCCRYGGEEFCVITPNTASPGVMLAAERFRERVEAMVVDGLKVTISIGAVIYPLNMPNAQGPADLFKAADNALYTAKRSGRNQVCMAETQ